MRVDGDGDLPGPRVRSDLAGFLLARIAEDRQAAEHAKWAMQGQWFPTAEDKVDEFVRHMSPARVLAECEAKRQAVRAAAGYADMDWVDHNPARIGATTAEEVLAKVLCLLALPYADHPDYREEWRP